jgi:hypothetical protein
MRIPRAQKLVSANLPTPDQAANLPLEAPVDAAEAWERFSAAWPFDPVPYRRAAARAEFEKLTATEREEAITSAAILAKSRRASGRIAAPDARRWIKEKRWKAFKRNIASASTAARPPSARLNVRTG